MAFKMAEALEADMAGTGTQAKRSPVLQPGRPADPVPPAPPVADANNNAAAKVPVESSTDPLQIDDQSAVTADGGTDHEVDEKTTVMSRQHNNRRLIRQCERVLLLEFNTLAMPDWPDDFAMAAARRRRDLWLFSATLTAIVFLAGVPGLVPAWIAGTGFGALVLVLLAGIPAVRRLFSDKPSHLDLVIQRQRRLKEARSHIQHLEGNEGLAWQCAMMSEHNPALKSQRFNTLIRLSEQRVLARQLRHRKHIRLYLIYMLEAEKAYERLQNAYFQGHQLSVDKGWIEPELKDDTADVASMTVPEPKPDA
ncbi:hypothetical protein [Marinobacter sp. BGYM27]|uniref:hypothetical protein n=1 Tax=Marinobacter sp. BGYM27 TaxID=2975597 RepID=UPI0021A80AC8|nr:hypothetical protein [Marinobacter sp. BGYM27]MDG5498741.1 hypothetical protein [Marinobacter sp. BGYM27]